MANLKNIFLLYFTVLFGCSDVTTGPVEVKWDRDGCERCRMVLSDRMHSAQVRGGPQGQKTKVYKCDDFGCAVLWLEKQPWKNHSDTEIWVNDHRDGHWIDARQAHYISGQNTPMSFGLGAQDTLPDQALTFVQAVEHVQQREARVNQSGSDLQGHMHEHHNHSQ